MVSTDGTSVADPSTAEKPQADGPGTPVTEPKRQTQPRRPRPIRRKKIDRALIDFQPDVVEIEERPVPGKARWTLYIVILLIISVVAWACLTEVDRVVTAEGTLSPTVSPIIVQPRVTEEIREIKAEFGQIVRPGDVLAVMDNVITQVDVDKLRDTVAASQASLARLLAERNGGDFEIPAGDDDVFFREQRNLFDVRQEEYRSSTRELEQAVAQYQAELKTNQTSQENGVEKLEVMVAMEETIGRLRERNNSSEFEFLQYKLRRLESQGALEDLKSRHAELLEQVAQAEEKLKSYQANWLSKINQEIVDVRQKLNDTQSDLLKAQRAEEYTLLTVPEDLPALEYVVLETADRVSVAEGEKPLFKLMPVNVDLEAKVDIPARDIGMIRQDQPVRVKLEAFPYQKHGALSGTIKTISEGSFTEREGQQQEPVYKATIRLHQQRLDDLPDSIRLLPGMVTSCEVKVGHRRVIDYFLYPLIRQLDNSIQEP